MLRPVVLLALILALLGVHASASAQLSRTVVFADNPGTQTLNHDGVEVVLQPMAMEDETIEVSAFVRVPGFPPLIVREDPPVSGFHPRWVGIGRLSTSDPAPSVLLAGFTGGAHCCATLRVLTPDNGRLRVLEFPERDGGPMDAFPTDIDGDGVLDIVLQDDSFRYQFASGAGSYSPPTVYNLYRGQIVNVTTQPGYRRMWQDYARETRSLCADRSNDDRNGACAAYVAASARLGSYAQALREVGAMAYSGRDLVLPEGCRVDLVNSGCPAGQEVRFHAFVPALIWHLRRQGYIE